MRETFFHQEARDPVPEYTLSRFPGFPGDSGQTSPGSTALKFLDCLNDPPQPGFRRHRC